MCAAIKKLLGRYYRDEGRVDNSDNLSEHIHPGAWERQLRELAAALSLLPEAFGKDESGLEQVIAGSDPEADRHLARLSDRLTAMALWHEQKAQMLHTAAIELGLHLRQSGNDRLH